jgi:hypothetical protein
MKPNWREELAFCSIELSCSSVTWKFPARDGSSVTVQLETHYCIRREVYYEEEKAKVPARDRGNVYEAAKLDGQDSPYDQEIIMKLKNVMKTVKQPKAPASPPASPT